MVRTIIPLIGGFIMEKQLRLKQVMLAASLMLSGALHAMDSTDAKNLDTTSIRP